MTLARQYVSMALMPNKLNTSILVDGPTMLPTFMPVATQAALKGLTSQQVEELGVTLMLNNT